MRHIHLSSGSLFRLGYAIEKVRSRYDLDEVTDSYLPEVQRAANERILKLYNPLSRFVAVNLSRLLETKPMYVVRACNPWTRGRLREFLELVKTPAKEKKREGGPGIGSVGDDGDGDFESLDGDRGEESEDEMEDGEEENEDGEEGDDNDEEEEGDDDHVISSEDGDDVFDAEKSPDSPWQTLKANVELLVDRGFDKRAIRRCLFVVTHPSVELVAQCDIHADAPPLDINMMTIEDQKAILNLVAYHLEKNSSASASG